jgi:two-component system response regulator GlrR
MGTPTVLIIDDDRLTRWSVSKILERAGYQVREANSFAEGEDSIEGERPELVLLDVKLPDGDGFALLRWIQTRHPGLPVIMMTAHASQETSQKAESLGAQGHLAKPCDPEGLLALVVEALGTRRLPNSLNS